MALTTRLELRQSQQLVMTPQLQQAIKLLQLSNMELGQFVEAELERNPLLEREEDREDAAAPDLPAASASESEAESDVSAGGDWDEPAAGSIDLVADPGAGAADLDADGASIDPEAGPGEWGPAMGSDSWSTVKSQGAGSDGEQDIEAYLTCPDTLKDHLTSQLNLAMADPVERMAGAYLIDLVDDAGYMRADIDEVAARIGLEPQRLAAVLTRLQTFDPPGVMARNLKECLTIQLKERGRFDALIARLIDNLELLAAHNVSALRRAVGTDMEDLSDMIGELRALNPKPGAAFGAASAPTVVPDVMVRPASDGSWIVELNSETLPRVLVNRSYFARVSAKAGAAGDKEFLVDCLNTANWLVKSLDQRARTILKVAEEIVRQQDAFLIYGVQHLRPLNLKTVADAIKMHESTVSRVTSSKYMATPRGLFELKYFFNAAIASAGDGEAHSSVSVRHRIKQLIDAEPADGVLSDDQLVEVLQRGGIEIARRTVAKYREAMKIPSSVQRRREKRAMAETKLAG